MSDAQKRAVWPAFLYIQYMIPWQDQALTPTIFQTVTPSTELPIQSADGTLEERMIFGWWNTSLSPVGKPRSSQGDKSTAAEIVQLLIKKLGVSCLALGEVTETDLKYLAQECQMPSLRVFNGTLQDGRLIFDTGLIYDSSQLRVSSEKALIISHGTRNLKLANQITINAVSDNSAIHVFVTHWPSRGFTEENIPARKVLAARLKMKVAEIEENLDRASIILIGDFNEEPFDESMSTFLSATRDRDLAASGKGYLYNPFWRHLGESEPHSINPTNPGTGGSYYHRGGYDTKWRTFDQILFSSSFLGAGNWFLNEKLTTIVRTESLLSLIRREGIFDHLPVLGVIGRKLKCIKS